VTLWDLVDAYRTLSNGGLWSPLRLTQAGVVEPQKRIYSKEAAFIVSDILSDRESRRRTFSLESPLSTRFWTAVKTGTSKGMRDNWCIGFSDRYTVGVWAGNFSGELTTDDYGVTVSYRKIFLAAMLCGAIFLETSAQTEEHHGPVIRQVDHLLIESGNPVALFKFFAGTLRLPEAWPLTNNQGSITGGLGAGNIILEIFRYAEAKSPSPAQKARYAGIAFEPYPLANALQELQTRGLHYDPPQPYISKLPTGEQGTLWTTVPLPTFSRPGMSIFLYQYSQAFLNMAVRRKQLGNRLTLEGGGPLGLHSIIEVTIATTDLERDRANWSRLLGTPELPNRWRAGGGPAIRLVKGPADAIQSVTFKVASLEKARDFLKQNQLLGVVDSSGVSLDPRRIQGLSVRLTQ
jgi:hypothetical protein